MRSCRRCGFAKMKAEQNKCPSCNYWQWDDGGALAGLSGGDESILYEDIVSAEVTRVKTKIIDECLGGGLVVSDLVLLGGLPGGGKSTLVLQIAQAFCALGTCMYIAAEEDVKAIKARGMRLTIEVKGRLRFVPAMGGVENIGELLLRHRPAFIIVDSLDALTGHNDAQEIVVLDAIKKYCVELQAPALVTSQVNKQGDYSGLMAKQHAVDVLLTLAPMDEFRSDETGEAIRMLETLKNRSGRAFTQTFFEMTAKGLVLTLDPTLGGSEGNGSEQDAAPEEDDESEEYAPEEDSVSV